MVIIYRGSRLMEVEFKLRRIRVEHIGLPNIVAGERIVPEYLQHDAAPSELAKSIVTFLRNPGERAETKRKLREVAKVLGMPGASKRAAALALETAGLN
jgi:lipid-A-disaccharide synthase